MTLLWPFDCNLYSKLFDNRYACNILCTYYDIWCQLCFCSFSVFSFSFSIFANILPRSQLIEQSSWQMFNWAPFSGSLAPSRSTLSVPTWTPLSACSVAFSDPAQTVLSSLSTPSLSEFPTRAPLLVSLYAATSQHPLDTLLTPSRFTPLSLWPVPYWILHTTMAARNQCPRGIWIRMYNWSWSSLLLFPLSLSLVSCFFFLFFVALCLLCCWQTVYYFVDKCVFELDSPREGAGVERELN